MIDYGKIAAAVQYYKNIGFEYIEVPWLISEDTMRITAPSGVRLFNTFAGNLVASGEQSFLEIRKKFTDTDLQIDFQCVTPCFRDEPVQDELHKQYFIKNELITVIRASESTKDYIPWGSINFLIDKALKFFMKYSSNVDVITVPMSNSLVNLDIMLNGIEVGSYGYRHYENFFWCYGTGCAEPRLSQALLR